MKDSGVKQIAYTPRDQGQINYPTQHHFLGVNMTALSEGNFFQRSVYGIANTVNLPVQYMMGRGVNDNSMRNLNGTATTTDEFVLTFGTAPLMFVGGGEASVLSGESTALKSWFMGGKTFNQYKVAYWATRIKPAIKTIVNEDTGQVFKIFQELHHRFIPQRAKWAPNWLKNNRINLKELNSIDHAKVDPYRARFLPKWVREMFDIKY